MLRIYTFGGLRIEHSGQPLQLSTQKARDLLAYLVTFRDRPHPRPVLTGILWPDLPEGKARRRHCLLRLLAEAAAADALPTVADLAGGLDVSPRTIRTDLAALRRQGHPVRTRGIKT